MSVPLTDSERGRILELHGEGMSRNRIAREVGRSSYAVSKTVADAGLSFARGDQVKAATEAVRVDNASRRANAIRRLYEQSERVFDRLDADVFKATGYDKSGNAIVTDLHRDEIPPADYRHLSATAANMLHSAAKLEQVDAGRNGGQARSVVDRMWDALLTAEDETGDE